MTTKGDKDDLEVVSVGSSNNIENIDADKKYYMGFQKKVLKHSRTQSEHNTEDVEENSILMKNIKMKEYFEDTFEHSKITNTIGMTSPKDGLNNFISIHPNNDTTFETNNMSSGWNSVRKTTNPSTSNFQEMELSNKAAKFSAIKEEKETPETDNNRARARTQPANGKGHDPHQKKITQFEDLMNKNIDSHKETKIIMVKSKKINDSDIQELSGELRASDVFQEVMTDSLGDSDGGESDGAKKKSIGDFLPKSSFCKKSLQFDTETRDPDNYQNYVHQMRSSSERDKNISFSGDSTSSRSARVRWKQLSHFFSAMWLLRHHEVKKLDNVDLVDEDMEVYRRMSYGNMSTFRRVNSGIDNAVLEKAAPPHRKIKNFREALEEYLRVDSFCMCAESGRDKDIKCMEEILDQDPKKFMRSPKDPEHIANRQNAFGQTALYLAAKNGNLNVVKYLHVIGVNHDTISNVGQGISEIPIHAAARWGHLKVLEYLFQEHSYSDKEISSCLQISTVKNVTDFLKKKLKKKSTPRFFSCFGLKALCN